MVGSLLFPALCLQLAAAPAPDPRRAPARSDGRPAAVSVEWGIVGADGSVSVTALGLGDGGMPAAVDPGAAEGWIRVTGPGSARTPGGAEVEVREAGCHVRFPSGERLLVDERARVHHRDGAATLPAFHGVTLRLADGTTVHVRPGGAGSGPAQVGLGFRGESVRLWNEGRPGHEIVAAHQATEATFLALGGGSTLYRGTNLTPVLVFERVLSGREETWPPVRVVILGDVLRSTCAALPEHAPRKSVMFPLAAERAVAAAEILAEVFPVGVRGAIRVEERAADWIAVGLREGVRLDVALLRDGGEERLVTTLGLGEHGESSVEWVAGPGVPSVHLMREGLLPKSEGQRHVHRITLTEVSRAIGSWCPSPPPPRERLRALELMRRVR